MLNKLEKKIWKYYVKHDQWLELETMYKDNGELTEQSVCLVNKDTNHCIFCTRIRTFKDLAPSELGHQPYLKVDGTEFTITIPTFTYLTKADLANAIDYIVRENVWPIFNVRIDNKNISEFINNKRNLYKISPDEIGRFIQFEKENQNGTK